jgi:hypothetical protein
MRKDENCWKWMRMDDNGWKWMRMDYNSWEFMWMDENEWEWRSIMRMWESECEAKWVWKRGDDDEREKKWF